MTCLLYIKTINMEERNCRVCGLYIDEAPWGEDGKTPTYDICPCCGVEFGNEDYILESVKRYRDSWLNGKMRWFEPKRQPENWKIEEQLKNIPCGFE
jgi:hypothetical protein